MKKKEETDRKKRHVCMKLITGGNNKRAKKFDNVERINSSDCYITCASDNNNTYAHSRRNIHQKKRDLFIDKS